MGRISLSWASLPALNEECVKRALGRAMFPWDALGRRLVGDRMRWYEEPEEIR